MKCLNCGNELKQGVSFCTVCGQKVVEENYQQKEVVKEQNIQQENISSNNKIPKSKICPVCSNELKENAMFCNKCGTAVDGTENKVYNEEPVKSPSPVNTKTKSSSNNIITLVVVLAVILIVSTVAAFIIINRNNDKKKEESKISSFIDDKKKQKDDNSLIDDLYDDIDDEDDDDVDIDDIKVFVSDIDTTLYVRKYPRYDSRVVSEIDDNTMMFFFGEKEKGRDEEGDYRNWYEVKTEDGKVGWVLADDVRIRNPYEIEEEIIEVYKPKTSYYQVYKSDVTWEEANTYAQQMGGHLVCINSEEEFNKVCAMAESYGVNVFWTGMKRTTYEFWEEVYWQDGTKMTYSNWMSGEPTYSDKDGTSENYLVIFNVNNSKAKGWVFNDVANDITRYYTGKIGYIVEFEE